MSNIDINLQWSTPKTYIAKKEFNYELMPCIEIGYDWYVYYYYLNPKTKKFEKIKEDGGINELKSIELRTRAIQNLREAVERFLLEYSPFEIKEINTSDDSWSIPDIYIASEYINEKLSLDIDSDWYVFYYFLDPKTNKRQFFKEKGIINKIEKVNDRIIALKNLRNSIEQKLIKGFNPIDEKGGIKITKDEYKEFINLKRKNELNIKKYSSVFKDSKSEEIFHNILLNRNVIDKKNEPKRGFNSVVYNSFNLIISLHDRIFNTKTLNVFVEFLEEKYNFKPSDKTKFGNINHKLNQEIADFVEEELKSSRNTNKHEF